MTGTMLYAATFLLLSLHVRNRATGCEFPAEWRGRWFLGRVGEVTITDTSISHKGICLRQLKEYFLIESKDQKCYQCLQILPRHQNVIQYRESFCMGLDSMANICDVIHDEVILNTLIRDPHIPSPCPFEHAYYISYNNNSGGFCRSFSSYASPCASGSQYHFRFEKCPSVAYSENQELNLECLGNWTDKGGHYMIGHFSGLGMDSRDVAYRCIMYHSLGTVVYLGTSGDATCRGIRSHRDGPLVIEMTKDVFGWPDAACQFPQWVTEKKWRDLSDRTITPDNGGQALTLSNDTGKLHDISIFRCLKLSQINITAKHFVAMASGVQGCTKSLRCIKIHRRHKDILEIGIGTEKNWDEPCLATDFKEQDKSLLLPRHTSHVNCPYQGRYKILTERHCFGELLSGCSSPAHVNITVKCNAIPEDVVGLECLHVWHHRRRQFMIAKQYGSLSGRANCFTFRNKGDITVLSTEHSCNLGATNTQYDNIRYKFHRDREACPPPPKKQVVAGPGSSSGSSKPDPNGHDNAEARNKEMQYKHVGSDGVQQNLLSSAAAPVASSLSLLRFKLTAVLPGLLCWCALTAR